MNDAAQLRGNDETTVAITLKDCVLTEEKRNLDYCERTNTGVGDRVLITEIHLREIAKIKHYFYDDSPWFIFYPQFWQSPSLLSIIDETLFGRRKAFERYVQRREENLKSATFVTGGSWGCEDFLNQEERSDDYHIAFDRELNEVDQFLSYAKSCRDDAGESLEITIDKR